ncbi:chemotaxis protein CheW, partial [Nocardioides sp. SOB77]
MTFTLDERVYGVDVAAVQEVLRGQPRTRIPLAPTSVAGLINLRGQVL